MALNRKQRAAARAEQVPNPGHVRGGVALYISRHPHEFSVVDRNLLEDVISNYAAAASDTRSPVDPRERVWFGAWSSHKRHDRNCDCRSRMHVSPISSKRSEKCLRHYKRRRRRMFERGHLVLRQKSEKGGLLKAVGRRRARGRAHAVWFGPAIEACIKEIQRANRGLRAEPDAVKNALGLVSEGLGVDLKDIASVAQPAETLVDQPLDASGNGVSGVVGLDQPHRESELLGNERQQPWVGVGQPARQMRGLLSKFFTPDGRRRVSRSTLHGKASEVEAGQQILALHGPLCTCENCMAAHLEQLPGHDPPAVAQP